MSLAYILPKGRREAAARFAVGTVCGLVFGGTAGLKIAIELGIDGAIGPVELALMGSAAASLCAWWVLGFVLRVLQRGRVADGLASLKPTAGAGDAPVRPTGETEMTKRRGRLPE